MNRRGFKKQIKTDFQWLIDLGYEYSSVERNIKFTKTFNNDDYILEMFWAEYNHYMISVKCSKKLYQIEKVIKEHTGYYDSTVWKRLSKIKIPDEFSSIVDDIYNLEHFNISEYFEIALFSKAIEFLYKQHIMLFFEQYQSVEDIMTYLSKTEIDKHCEFIGNNHDSMILRKLVIMKQTNYNGFDDLYESYSKFLYQKVKVENLEIYLNEFYDLKKLESYFLT